MSENKYLIDDRCIIPEDIKNMSPEQLLEEISVLENDIKKQKDKAKTNKETA